MHRHTGPNSLSDQELHEIFGNLSFPEEGSDEWQAEQDAKTHAVETSLKRQREELARYEALQAIHKMAAETKSRQLAAERAALNEVINEGLAPLRARPEPAAQIGALEPSADKKSPSRSVAADGRFPDPVVPTDSQPTPCRTSHYVSKEREDIFFRELRRRSTEGHPFRDARDPLTGRAASVLLNTHAPVPSTSNPAADKKSSARTFKSAPPWRDLSPRARAVYGIEAAKAGGRARAITINLGDIIKAKAPHQKEGALRFIMKRIDKGLKDAFDNAPPLFVALEHSGELGLHLHGIVELSEHQTSKVAKVIREAVGIWREHVDKQVKIEPIYARGWATYITEDSALMKEASGHRAYYMANDLRRRAEEIHKKDCEFIKIGGGL